jgi:hypothetical protein
MRVRRQSAGRHPGGRAAEVPFPSWSTMGAFERHKIFLRAADVMTKRGEEAIVGPGPGDWSVPAVLRVQPGVLHPGTARGRGGDQQSDG